MTEFTMLIDGRLEAGDRSLDVINPATGLPFAVAPMASLAQLNRAVEAAKRAFPQWRDTHIAERRKALNSIAETLEANAADLAGLLTREQGKPTPDALAEVGAAAAFFRYFATIPFEAKRLEDAQGRCIEYLRKPLGVIAAIVPWNFPLTLMAFKLPPALLAGNTVVLKPAPTTPLTTLRVGALIKDLLPQGVLNVIGDPGDLGAALTAHPDVRKISFTGSTETGKRVMAGAADGLKRITLELGGNDAAIVLDDVDPKEIAPQIFYPAFHNAGQICIAIKRLYVHERVYDAVCDELAALAEQTIVGDGAEQGTQMGPLQNQKQFHKVRELIEAARRDGKIVAGGDCLEGGGYFIRPTLVRDIADGARLVDEEQFGPVLPVIKFSDVDDALARANRGGFGLGGSVWSKDVERARHLAQQMNAGTVWINKHADLSPAIPFGGAAQSGLGVELGEEGLAEFTQLHVINA